MTYAGDEARRGWKNCRCPIYCSGIVAGKFSRRNTHQTDWAQAEAVAREWEQAKSWDGAPAQPAPQAPASVAEGPAPGAARMKLEDAITAYLAIREGSKIAPSTIRKYRTFTKTLQTYASQKGYLALDQFTAADIDIFYSNWKLGPRAKGKALCALRGFFRFCINREWLAKSPVSSDLKPPQGANRQANKVPFTDLELDALVNACDKLGTTQWKNGTKSGEWNGEDVKDFIWLLTYTGLRISDAALFRIDQMRGNEVFLRAKKNGGDVFTWLPDWLTQRLQQRAKLHGARPFVLGESERIETVTDLWRRRLNRVFELAGKFEDAPTPHRFRHTFARILLEKGVPVADVADLMGDDEKTVRLHYARWVPSRQARLTSILRDAFTDKPKPKLVAIR